LLFNIVYVKLTVNPDQIISGKNISVMIKYNINDDTVSGFRHWFISYTKSFQSPNPAIQHGFSIKKEHSLRVCKEILNLGSLLGLHPEELRIAETAALFHDIGRFEQYKKYGTFADGASENHAELSIKILREKCVLDKLARIPKDLIIKSILYHNRIQLPDAEDDAVIFFGRLLRDADKLDIFRVVIENYQKSDSERVAAVGLDLPDRPEISDVVLNSLLACRQVSGGDLRTLNDAKLLLVGWIYDLNFPPTFQAIRDRGYLEIIRNTLPVSRGINDAFIRITDFLERKIAQAL
jgi:putative nucleotidyltransferase with HDIG domain